MSDLTPILAQLQGILARFLPLDSLRDLSQAGIYRWNKSNAANIAAWFKQSLTPGFEYLSSLVPSISKTGITRILTHLQNILDRLSPLDSLRGLSLAGIDLWHKSNTADIVEWFKQSLTRGFEYLSSITLSASKINITRYLSQGWEFLREIILGNLLAVWVVAFVTTMAALSRIGFGRVGITKGTPASSFQSRVYGPFTPKGGIFATLTSLGMLGLMIPVNVWASAAVATTVTVVLRTRLS